MINASEIVQQPEPRPAFAQWMLQQRDRGEAFDQLLAGARADPSFPKHGDAEAVRKRLRAVMADGDMFELIDDLELDWASM